MIGIVLVLVAVAAVMVGRGDLRIPGLSAGFASTRTVHAVIGSEKATFFDDPRVQEELARHGYEVDYLAAGSRRIATDVNLAEYDFAFPSSAPAGAKIASENANLGSYTPFHSPMALATFTPILSILAEQGVAREENGHWFIDIERYMELSGEGVRWRDLSEEYPSPRNVQISSTDVRTSNSAAMYLSVLAWTANGGQVPGPGDVDRVADIIRPLFAGQGYTESSSAGPFSDYLSQGMGSKPMVMVYEAQFVGELLAPDSRIREEMVLAYPDPTVLSEHTVIALSEDGVAVAELLQNDPELQQLAAQHGYRPNNPALFDEVFLAEGRSAPPNFLATVDPPAYEQLESLIENVGSQYAGTPMPPEEEVEQQ
ncbi:MAG TPA: hypothetical protein VFC72_00785 [Corynebacterium sp.]|nr:hypothetical protein [Corynebacterium sp.]